MQLLQVFELGGDVVPDEMAYGVMRLIAEGAGQDDAEAMADLRSQAVASYLKLLTKPNLPDVLLKVDQAAHATADSALLMITSNQGDMCCILRLHGPLPCGCFLCSIPASANSKVVRGLDVHHKVAACGLVWPPAPVLHTGIALLTIVSQLRFWYMHSQHMPCRPSGEPMVAMLVRMSRLSAGCWASMACHPEKELPV